MAYNWNANEAQFKINEYQRQQQEIAAAAAQAVSESAKIKQAADDVSAQMFLLSGAPPQTAEQMISTDIKATVKRDVAKRINEGLDPVVIFNSLVENYKPELKVGQLESVSHLIKQEIISQQRPLVAQKKEQIVKNIKTKIDRVVSNQEESSRDALGLRAELAKPLAGNEELFQTVYGMKQPLGILNIPFRDWTDLVPAGRDTKFEEKSNRYITQTVWKKQKIDDEKCNVMIFDRHLSTSIWRPCGLPGDNVCQLHQQLPGQFGVNPNTSIMLKGKFTSNLITLNQALRNFSDTKVPNATVNKYQQIMDWVSSHKILGSNLNIARDWMKIKEKLEIAALASDESWSDLVYLTNQKLDDLEMKIKNLTNRVGNDTKSQGTIEQLKNERDDLIQNLEKSQKTVELLTQEFQQCSLTVAAATSSIVQQ